MNKIYLDNAATTPILPEVIEVISKSMTELIGNPSSSHEFGRKAKSQVEKARKNIAKQFNAQANEIFFTAGGSEADNLILQNAVTNLGVETIISSKIEHHAVLHTIKQLEKEFNTQVHWVELDDKGGIDLKNLEKLLINTTGKKLVSLMYINNEVGTILDIDAVCKLCLKYNSLFHSDTVQGVGHFDMDIRKTPIDFFVASAHKFHGPKGVGFAYIKNGFGVAPILYGGSQERGARAGTENVHSILGMEKALEIACLNMESEAKSIQEVKTYLVDQFIENFEGISFNGYSADPLKSSYIILNVRFPQELGMLLFQLDIQGIAVSGGSACQSGSNAGSHVLNGFLPNAEMTKTSIRFSFCKHNTKEEIDQLISTLKNILH